MVAKLGVFRTPRLLHDTATRLAPWASGYCRAFRVACSTRRVIRPSRAGQWVDIVGASTYPVCARQVEEMIAWRKAGAWDRAILAIGGVTTVERARDLLNEGANVAMVDTAAIFDPLLAVRFRSVRLSPRPQPPSPRPRPRSPPGLRVAAALTAGGGPGARGG